MKMVIQLRADVITFVLQRWFQGPILGIWQNKRERIPSMKRMLDSIHMSQQTGGEENIESTCATWTHVITV